MQFIPIRRTLAINQTGLKQFVRKCRLNDIMSNREIDAYFNEQQACYATTNGKGELFECLYSLAFKCQYRSQFPRLR